VSRPITFLRYFIFVSSRLGPSGARRLRLTVPDCTARVMFVLIAPRTVAPRSGRRAGGSRCWRHYDVSNRPNYSSAV